MSILYSTTATAKGGRRGSVRTDDGVLALNLAMPEALGGKGDATNPEQLFAAGYAACFENAVLYVARTNGATIDDADVEVSTTVGLSTNQAGGFALQVAIDVMIAGIDEKTAGDLVQAAHAACPYSNAIRGNVDVALSVRTR